jgi:uncharacterized coiled-coil DUF342 family protein
MNPEKRFGQIEEVLADVVIKVDRLADGQAKLLGHVVEQGVEIKSLTERVNHLADKTDGLQNQVTGLTIKTDALADKTDGLQNQVTGLQNQVTGLTIKTDALADKTDGLQNQTETIARAVAALTIDNQTKHQQLNDKLDNLMDFLREKLP